MEVLVFVSSNCPHCPKAVRIVKRIIHKYGEYGLKYRKIRAKTSEAKKLSAEYDISVYPTILFLNDEKKCVYRVSGVPNEDGFRKKIEQMLGLRKTFLGRIFERLQI